MTEEKESYQTEAIPTTLGEVLRALCAPFPEDHCGWRILTRRGPGDNWVWVKYPIGDFMKRRLAMSCSAGYDIDFMEDVEDGVAIARCTLVIYNPEQPTEHCMVVPGIGECELDNGRATADVWKTAQTYSLKDALEKVGVGVGAGGRMYTIPYRNPDGEQTDWNGIPLEAYNGKGMGGGKRDPGPGRRPPTILTDAGTVRTWLTAKAQSIDTSQVKPDAFDTHAAHLATELGKLGYNYDAVLAGAWGDDGEETTIQQVIALQQLARRTDAKEALQHLLE